MDGEPGELMGALDLLGSGPGRPREEQSMSTGSDWRQVKAKVRADDPHWGDADRVERRSRLRKQMLASVNEAQLPRTCPAEVPGPLVGPYELQELLGVGRSRMRQIVRYPTFPAPFQRLHGTTVWLRSDVEAWIAEYRQPRPAADDDEPA